MPYVFGIRHRVESGSGRLKTRGGKTPFAGPIARVRARRTSTTRSYSLGTGWPGKHPNGERYSRVELFMRRNSWSLIVPA